MKLIPCFLMALNIASGCSKSADTPVTTFPLNTSGLSYLALGDSYTIGESVSEAESFPYQLASSLSRNGIAVSNIKVIAKTGWTTNELKSAIAAQNLKQHFDVVTLLIGVNNQFRGYSSEVYRKEFNELLNAGISFAKGDKTKVFVISIPDWGATPFAKSYDRTKIAEDIDLFNAINKEESLKVGVAYTDITEESRNVATDPSLVAPDGLHPSGKMYAYWASQLLPKIESKIK